MPHRIRLLCLSILALLLIGAVRAQWSADPAINTPVCTAVNAQYYPEIVSIGSGSTVVVWHDFRPGSQSDMYVQKFDSTGTPRWASGGVALSTAPGHQWAQAITTDGSGGAIVAWHDERAGSSAYDIYARRITASGVPLWTTDGVPIGVAGSHDEFPAIAPDGTGGAYIAWGGTNLSMQRVDSLGNIQWTVNGLSVATGSGMYDNRWPKMVSDDSGGVIVAWQHDSFGSGWDIRAQRITRAGVMLWNPGGIAVSADSFFQEKPTLARDGAGGAIIAWEDHRNASWDIYAQRVNDAGVAQWTVDGVPVCTNAAEQRAPLGNHGTVSLITGDGAGGAIMTWQDWRSGSPSIYAQRLSGSGSAQWALNGVPVATGGNHWNVTITGDSAGGAFLTWEHDGGINGIDIYAQRIDGSGQLKWNSSGVAVSTPPADQTRPRMATDDAGAPIIVWQDLRNGFETDIYIHKISVAADSIHSSGNPVIRSVRDVPGDQGGVVSLVWTGIHTDTGSTPVPYYSIWRAIPSLPGSRASAGSADAITPGFKGPARRTTTVGGSEFDWEWIANQPGHGFLSYAYSAATLYDSMSTTNGKHYFLVSAHTTDPGVYFDSNIDSGYSVDNLAPLAPQNLSYAVYLDTVVLHWSPNPETDLRGYAIYRGAAPLGNVDTVTPYATVRDTQFTDADPLPSGYYLVRAQDVHGNYGPPSGQVYLNLTGVSDGEGVPKRTELFQNYPNPFNPATRIRYSLSARADVRVSVYNILGQEVARLVDGVQEPGYKTVVFNGEILPDGVYLFRLTAGAHTETKKMVLLK